MPAFSGLRKNVSETKLLNTFGIGRLGEPTFSGLLCKLLVFINIQYDSQNCLNSYVALEKATVLKMLYFELLSNVVKHLTSQARLGWF